MSSRTCGRTTSLSGSVESVTATKFLDRKLIADGCTYAFVARFNALTVGGRPLSSFYSSFSEGTLNSFLGWVSAER